MDLDAVADELYGLPLDDFISTRAAREKQAKAADNRELAADIRRLPKPNAVAWLVNQLVRHCHADIQALLEMGSGMREATANLSGDLRDLSRQQHRVIRGLVQKAEQIASAAGRRVSADTTRSLEETFFAALADPGAAETVAAGRLTAGLSTIGFAGLEGSGGQSARLSTEPASGAEERPRTKTPDGVKQHERARAKVARAKAATVAAVQARDEAQEKLQQADQAGADAGDRVERLRRELQEAVKAQSDAETSQRRAQRVFDRADRGAGDAHQRLADVVAEEERLA